MLETKYYCDHCGREIDINDKGIVCNGYLDIQINFENNNKVLTLMNSCDLCCLCTDTLFKMIKNYVKEDKK